MEIYGIPNSMVSNVISALLVDAEELKRQILVLREEQPELGDAMVAAMIGVTSRTLGIWLQEDRIFRVKWEIARDIVRFLSVESDEVSNETT